MNENAYHSLTVGGANGKAEIQWLTKEALHKFPLNSIQVFKHLFVFLYSLCVYQ